MSEEGVKVCTLCGTTLKPGQPHSATEPTEHQSMEMLIHFEDLDDDVLNGVMMEDL